MIGKIGKKRKRRAKSMILYSLGDGGPYRRINTIDELGSVLSEAEFSHTWIQGIGIPMCFADEKMWRAVGKMILEFSNPQDKAHPCA